MGFIRKEIFLPLYILRLSFERKWQPYWRYLVWKTEGTVGRNKIIKDDICLLVY
jgi:hypothetical protein